MNVLGPAHHQRNQPHNPTPRFSEIRYMQFSAKLEHTEYASASARRLSSRLKSSSEALLEPDYGSGCSTPNPKPAYNLDRLHDQQRNEPHPEPEGPEAMMDIIEYIKIV